MRNVLVVVAAAAVALLLLLGLHWLGVVSRDSVAIGFAAGLGVAIVLALANRKKGGTG